MHPAEKRHLAIVDPIQRQAERGFDDGALSPMDPPDVYAPPAVDPVSVEELHPFLRRLTAEHQSLVGHIDRVESAVSSVQESGFTREVHDAIEAFLQAFEEEFIPHSRTEELLLFQRLSERLVESGEHSRGQRPMTAVDLMLDEHLRANQLAAATAALLALAPGIPDRKSRGVVLASALSQLTRLIELLRLHVFREDNILFASAHRLLGADELDRMASRSEQATPGSEPHAHGPTDD